MVAGYLPHVIKPVAEGEVSIVNDVSHPILLWMWWALTLGLASQTLGINSKLVPSPYLINSA